MTVYPVYIFTDYFKRSYVFFGLTINAAEDFARNNNGYCAPSRKVV